MLIDNALLAEALIWAMVFSSIFEIGLWILSCVIVKYCDNQLENENTQAEAQS